MLSKLLTNCFNNDSSFNNYLESVLKHGVEFTNTLVYNYNKDNKGKPVFPLVSSIDFKALPSVLIDLVKKDPDFYDKDNKQSYIDSYELYRSSEPISNLQVDPEVRQALINAATPLKNVERLTHFISSLSTFPNYGSIKAKLLNIANSGQETIDEFLEAVYNRYKGETKSQPAQPSKPAFEITTYKPSNLFKGYKGGFDSKGKGTKQGDGKDAAMRQVANNAIVEVVKKNSSSATSLYEMYKKGWESSNKEQASLSEEDYFLDELTGFNFAYNVDEFENTPQVIMLARNSEFKNEPLQEATKNKIKEAHDNNAEFVVGDMPGVDEQFIDYLIEIGANFTVYHTGSKSRIDVESKLKPQSAQLFKPSIIKNEEGLFIINNSIPLNESIRIVEQSKDLIKTTSFKQTAGAVSWGHGLQWMRVNAMTAKQKQGIVVGKQLNGKEITEKMKEDLVAGLPVKNLPLYAYTEFDIHGNKLPQIPNEIIAMLANKGIDVSEYDASYNSVYDKTDNGSLIIHQDNTETNESPIITISLGRPMKFITYELNDPADYNISDSHNTAYRIALSTIESEGIKAGVIPSQFIKNDKVIYGHLTPSTLLYYAQEIDKKNNTQLEQFVKESLKAQFKNSVKSEYLLENGAVLVFSGNNRNVLHEIVFDEETNQLPMPNGFPELTVNKAFKGLGHADKFVKTNDYRVVLTLRKVRGTTVNNIDLNKLTQPTQSQLAENQGVSEDSNKVDLNQKVQVQSTLQQVTEITPDLLKLQEESEAIVLDNTQQPNSFNNPFKTEQEFLEWLNNDDIELYEGFWTRETVAKQTNKVFLFGDNTDDRVNTKYVPSSTQAVIRGLPNAIGIDTKKNRGTNKSSYFTDADFDVFKQQVDKAIIQAKNSGKIIVIPTDGIGTGKAMLAEKAPKLFEYLQQELNKLKENQEQKQWIKNNISKFKGKPIYFTPDNAEHAKTVNKLINGNAQSNESDVKQSIGGSDPKYYQLVSDVINPAIEELDNYLLDFLKAFNVKTKQFDELKSRLNVDALGATDVLNKLIWYVKHRNEETLPEESAHMLVALMGKSHPDIIELLSNITNWSEYTAIKATYLPLYKDEEKVKIEAIGKLIAKALVKTYKAEGLNKNKLQAALNRILAYFEQILTNIGFAHVMYYNQNVADKVAINVLSGNKDYIYKIKNINPNLDLNKELANNPHAREIVNTFASNNVKMTGSLAISATENIRRPEGQGIHDLDFKVKSFDVFNNEVLTKLPTNAIPAHYGWHKSNRSTFAYLIPLANYQIRVLERKEGFSNGWITNYELYNEKGEQVEPTQQNLLGVDFFVYKETTDLDDKAFTFEYMPASFVYEGKISLGTASTSYFFNRDKDQEDYVLRNPKSFIPFKEHIYYQTDNSQASNVKKSIGSLDPELQVNYQLRVVDTLLSLSTPKKTKRSRKYGETTNPERLTIRLNTVDRPYLETNIRKTLANKGVPSNQIDFIFDYMKSAGINEISTEDLAMQIAANYSYAVEINVAKQQVGNPSETLERLGSFTVGYDEYSIEYNEDGSKSFYENDRVISQELFEQIALNTGNLQRLSEGTPTQYYSKLTVPGGTNYTENEISTPLITPSIKGHAQFATDNGIGWFRSDDRSIGQISTNDYVIVEKNGKFSLYYKDVLTGNQVEKIFNTENEALIAAENTGIKETTKTRRILELQSDLFQKGRDKDRLVESFKDIEESEDFVSAFGFIGNQEEQFKKRKETAKNINTVPQNQFLQLLNKDNNWVTFFVKSVIQDSAKKGYEKVLFPTGNTASKVEGHTTLEEFKREKEDRIKELEENINKVNNYSEKELEERGYSKSAKKAEIEDNLFEINQLKQELERVDREGFGALKPIYNFYENTVQNILKKQFGQVNRITDEYGNEWFEVELTPDIVKQVDVIKLSIGGIEPTLETNTNDLTEIQKSVYDTLINAKLTNEKGNYVYKDGTVATRSIEEILTKSLQGGQTEYAKWLADKNAVIELWRQLLIEHRFSNLEEPDYLAIYEQVKDKLSMLGRPDSFYWLSNEKTGSESDDFEYKRYSGKDSSGNPKYVSVNSSVDPFVIAFDDIEVMFRTLGDVAKIQIEETEDGFLATYEEDGQYLQTSLTKGMAKYLNGLQKRLQPLEDTSFIKVIDEEVQYIKSLIEDRNNIINRVNQSNGTPMIIPSLHIGNKDQSLASTIGLAVVYADGSVGMYNFKNYWKTTIDNTKMYANKLDGSVVIRDDVMNRSLPYTEEQKNFKELSILGSILANDYGVPRIADRRVSYTFVVPASERRAGTEGINYYPSSDGRLRALISNPQSGSPLMRLKSMLNETTNTSLDMIVVPLQQRIAQLRQQYTNYLKNVGIVDEKGNQVYPEPYELHYLEDLLHNLQITRDFDEMIEILLYDVANLNAVDGESSIDKLYNKLSNIKAFQDLSRSIHKYLDELGEVPGVDLEAIDALKKRIGEAAYTLVNASKDLEEYLHEAFKGQYGIDTSNIVNETGWAKKVLGTLGSQHEPIVQAFWEIVKENASQIDEDVKSLTQQLESLQAELTQWAKDNGISLKQAMSLLLDENKNLIPKHNKKDYDDLREAIVAQDLDTIKSMVTGDAIIDVDGITTTKAAKLAKDKAERIADTEAQIEALRSQDENDVEEAVKLLEDKLEEWLKTYDYTQYDSAYLTLKGKSINPYLSLTSDKYSEAYKKVFNDPTLSRVYTGLQSILIDFKQALRGSPIKWGSRDLPHVPKTMLESLEDSSITSIPQRVKKQLLYNIEVREMDEVLGIRDYENEMIGNIPIFFSKPMKETLTEAEIDDIKTEVSNKLSVNSKEYRMEVDRLIRIAEYKKGVENKSMDFFVTLRLFGESVYNYKHKSTTFQAALALKEMLKSKAVFETDIFGDMKKDPQDPNKPLVKTSQNNMFEYLTRAIRSIYQGQRVQDKDVGITIGEKKYSGIKLLMLLKHHFSLKSLGFNIEAALSNFLGAQTNLYGKAVEGRHFTTKQLKKGIKALTKKDPKLSAFIGAVNIVPKHTQRAKVNKLSYSKLKSWLDVNNLMVGQRLGDEAIDNQVLAGIYYGYGIIDDQLVRLADVPEAQPLSEAFKVGKDDTIELGDATPELLNKIKAIASKLTNEIKGSMDDHDFMYANTTVAGQVLLHLRSWIPVQFKDRYKGISYDSDYDMLQVGRYRAAINEYWYGTNIPNRVVNLALGLSKLLVRVGGNPIKVRRDLDNAKFFQEAYTKAKAQNPSLIYEQFKEDYITIAQGKMKALATELKIYLVLLSALAFLALDDEDGEDWYKNYWITRKLYSSIDRLSGEIDFFFNPKSVQEIIKSPAPMMSYLSDTIGFFNNTIDETRDIVFGEFSSIDFKRERDATPIGHYLMKHIYLLGPMIKFLDLRDHNTWTETEGYEAGSRIPQWRI